VYRFTLQPGSGLPGLNDASYFTFAVEPVAEAEASKCADATVTYAMAVSNVKFRACGTSGSAPSAGAPQPSVSCADYQACRHAGTAAVQTSNWREALAYFEAAHERDPDKGGAWMDIGGAYVALGRYGELGDAWDKALRLGQPLGIEACRERTLQPCELGILWLGPEEVSFMTLTSRQKIFSGAPADVAVKRETNHASQGHVSLTLEANRKSYQLDFVPGGVPCEISLFVSCPDGSARQTAIANYVAAAIPRLATGRISEK
jgi:tetratricopeptide (TPR) repeat protein